MTLHDIVHARRRRRVEATSPLDRLIGSALAAAAILRSFDPELAPMMEAMDGRICAALADDLDDALSAYNRKPRKLEEAA